MPQIQELDAELKQKYADTAPDLVSLSEAVHVPDIVHSTVMRHAGPPADAQGLAQGLVELNAKWKSVTVNVKEISLAFEEHPYMHVSRADAEMHTFPLP